MAELLVEVRSQELPTDQVTGFLRRFAGRVFEDLMSHGIPMQEMRTGGTPRRLVVSVTGLPEVEDDREAIDIGPTVADAWAEDGEPTALLLEFARGVGRSPDELERRRSERGEVMAARRTIPGRPIAEAMAELLDRVLRDLLHVRDGAVGSEVWPRPITGWLALIDGEPLELTLDGQAAGRTSVGHPALSPESFEVVDWDDYVAALDDRGIVVAVEARVRALRRSLDAAAEAAGGVLVEIDGLVERLAAGCEIPGAVWGAFDDSTLDVPAELVRTALAERLGAFSLVDGDDGDRRLPRFVVAIDRPDDPDGRVRRGLERSVAGVLDDLRFFVETDRRQPLAQRVRRLEQLTFHPTLGTWADKGQRVARLAELVCQQLGWEAAAEAAFEATSLLDADLTTAVVAAYPSLRGVVGGLYAREEGYVETVWKAIRDHVLPVGDGPIPSGRPSLAVAVADRLDTLVGLLGVGAEAAVGEHRAPRPLAAGLLRIVIEGTMDVDLDLLAARAVLLYGDRLERGSEELLRDLQALLDDRLDHLLGQRGYAPDEIASAKAVGTRSLPDLVARIQAIRAVRHEPAFHRLVAGAQRLSTVVEGAEEAPFDRELLVEDAERELADVLDAVGEPLRDAADAGRWVDVLHQLETLGPPLEHFFTDVLVRPEDDALRRNRLALLQACRRRYWRVARLAALRLDRPPETV